MTFLSKIQSTLLGCDTVLRWLVSDIQRGHQELCELCELCAQQYNVTSQKTWLSRNTTVRISNLTTSYASDMTDIQHHNSAFTSLNSLTLKCFCTWSHRSLSPPHTKLQLMTEYRNHLSDMFERVWCFRTSNWYSVPNAVKPVTQQTNATTQHMQHTATPISCFKDLYCRINMEHNE
jgi:hypothetical protein